MPPGAPPLPPGLPSALRLPAPALQSGCSRGPPLPAPGPWLRPQLPSRPSRSVWLLLGKADSGGPGGTAQVCSRGRDGTRCLPGPRAGAACKEARTGRVQWAPLRQFGATSGGESSRRRPCWPSVGKDTSLWSEWPRKTSVVPAPLPELGVKTPVVLGSSPACGAEARRPVGLGPMPTTCALLPRGSSCAPGMLGLPPQPEPGAAHCLPSLTAQGHEPARPPPGSEPQ